MVRLAFGLFLVLLVSASYYGGKTVMSAAGIGPDNPLYIFDNLMEKIDAWAAKDDEKKTEKLIGFTDEKFAEAGAMLAKGDSASAATALSKGDKYVADALSFINHLKTEGLKTNKLSESLGTAVLEKQKILAGIYKDAPEAAKTFIENTIKNEQAKVGNIVSNFDENTSKKLTSEIEQTAGLVADKLAEAEELEEKEALEDLTKQEKIYNIWIEQLYAVNEEGKISMNAHISRRDPKCSEFRGKLNLFINNIFYRSFTVAAAGYDDVRGTFDEFFLESGSYKIKGELVDKENNIISRKVFDLVI